MSGRQHILKCIAGIARRLGRTPSLSQFVSSTGLSKHSVFRFFPKWNNAVRAAGLEPCRLYGRRNDSELLSDWGESVRKRGGLPSRRGYRREGKYEPATLEKRFGGWSSVPRAFRKFAKGNEEWADVMEILCGRAPKKDRRPRHDDIVSAIPGHAQHPPLQGRATYGNPLAFSALRHEPINEQGVVVLFALLAAKLGYVIEAVQTGFPDCEAKRQIAPGRWQQVHIEFEFESRNFRDHGHPPNGCDVIVCWRHNWQDCPARIEIVELSSVIKSLAKPED